MIEPSSEGFSLSKYNNKIIGQMRKLAFGMAVILASVTVLKAITNDPKSDKKDPAKNIVELAVGTDALSTLVAAVKAGGLVETLQGEGPFTVFAPTNEAFAALPKGTLESLLKPENKDQLVAILTYHVIPGKVYSKDLKDNMKAATANGAEVTITTKWGAKVNGANVVSADIEATNGVVHVIDKVILPPKK